MVNTIRMNFAGSIAVYGIAMPFFTVSELNYAHSAAKFALAPEYVYTHARRRTASSLCCTDA